MKLPSARASTHQAWVEAAIADPDRSPSVLVMVYGHNYVRSGMTAADVAELSRMWRPVVDNGACVVLVLPAYVGTDAWHAERIARYRAWATGVADAETAVVAVDWQPVADAHPTDWVNTDGTPGDGIHMTAQASGIPYSDAVNAGVDECTAVTS